MINKTLPDVVLHECSIEGCPSVTTQPFNSNPRYRWIIGLRLMDEGNVERKINLCPSHVRRLMPGANEDFFQRVENAEDFVRVN